LITILFENCAPLSIFPAGMFEGFPEGGLAAARLGREIAAAVKQPPDGVRNAVSGNPAGRFTIAWASSSRRASSGAAS
jgi:hypothetical protein